MILIIFHSLQPVTHAIGYYIHLYAAVEVMCSYFRCHVWDEGGRNLVEKLFCLIYVYILDAALTMWFYSSADPGFKKKAAVGRC